MWITSATDSEMWIDEPILRIRWKSAVPSVMSRGASVQNVAMESGTQISPTPKPCSMEVQATPKVVRLMSNCAIARPENALGEEAGEQQQARVDALAVEHDEQEAAEGAEAAHGKQITDDAVGVAAQALEERWEQDHGA